MTIQENQSLPQIFGSARSDATRYRVLYFMRTRDCPVCRLHVRRLVALRERLASLSAEVTVFAPEEVAPDWAQNLPYPFVSGPSAYRAVGLTKTLGAIQQSGTIVATFEGRVVSVRQATVPFQAFDERELLERLAANDAHAA